MFKIYKRIIGLMNMVSKWYRLLTIGTIFYGSICFDNTASSHRALGEWTREKSLIFDATNCVPEPVGRFTNTLRPIRNSRTQENFPSNEWILNGFKTLSRLSRSNYLVIEALWDAMIFAYVFNGSNSQSDPTTKIRQFIGTQLVVSNIRLFSRVHSPRARCEEAVLSG